MAGFGDGAFGEAGFFLFRRDHPIDPLGRVQPVFAEFVQATGGGGDVFGHDLAGQTRRRSLTGHRRGIARRQAGREREGFETGGRGVARTVFERGAEAQRPEFVETGMQDAEGGVVGTGDDGQVLVGNRWRNHEGESPVFGDFGSDDEARKVFDGLAHHRA